MKNLFSIFFTLLILAPAFSVTAQELSTAPCNCICKPQAEYTTEIITGSTGVATTVSKKNTCTPPTEKKQLGKVDNATACVQGCTAVCSNFESCAKMCTKDSDCDSGMVCGKNNVCSGNTANDNTISPVIETPAFKPVAPKLSLNIPNLSFPDYLNVKREGNYYYIPFISVYLAAAFRLGLGIAAVLAVIMIMVGGFMWIASAGDSGRIKKAKEIISTSAVGLLLSFGSFLMLQIVNPDLVNLQPLKIKIVQPEVLEISDDQESDMIDASAYPSGPVTKPTWTAETFICPPNSAKQPAAGVIDPAALVPLNCGAGIVLAGSADSGGGKATPAVRNALCAAGSAADAAGYVLKVNSSYRPFEKQASLWCGEGAQKYPNTTTRKTYYAVPGYSNHGLGNAVDVMLIDKTTGKNMYYFSGSGQCKSDPENVEKVANIMISAGFVRYEAEIWHFEINTGLPKRGAYTGLPAKCK